MVEGILIWSKRPIKGVNLTVDFENFEYHYIKSIFKSQKALDLWESKQ